jgi:hypothetical protein
MISFFIVIDFGLGIKGRNLFHLLQEELLTGLQMMIELPLPAVTGDPGLTAVTPIGLRE